MRTASLRTQIARALEPATEKLKRDLAALIEQRIQRLFVAIDEACATVLSAAASEILDARDDHQDHAPAAPAPRLPKVVHRDLKPENLAQRARPTSPSCAPSDRAIPDRAAPQGNRKNPVTCRKCGFVGGNARGCGTAHPTQGAPAPASQSKVATAPTTAPMTAIAPSGRPKLTAAEIEAAKARIAARRDRNAVRAGISAGPPDDEAEPEDDQDDGRWSAQRIAEERERAEASKHEGALPDASASWEVDRDGIRELDF